ncbi:hypothetical protein HF521_014665 [Silurus meridionalis]|uniref:Uncharacterized protein n=1 Tax=Silurus meridionalis TaxID=175797 RepID=A0A8T0A870_SILME|nr:hypothetical protein HF521_014665 [Silurus meridionalis]
MTGSNTETTISGFGAEIKFTDEEMMWLLNISSEVPIGKLTPLEEGWCEMGKPKTATEAQLFQLLASKHFGLARSDTFSMYMLKTIRP